LKKIKNELDKIQFTASSTIGLTPEQAFEKLKRVIQNDVIDENRKKINGMNDYALTQGNNDARDAVNKYEDFDRIWYAPIISHYQKAENKSPIKIPGNSKRKTERYSLGDYEIKKDQTSLLNNIAVQKYPKSDKKTKGDLIIGKTNIIEYVKGAPEKIEIALNKLQEEMTGNYNDIKNNNVNNIIEDIRYLTSFIVFHARQNGTPGSTDPTKIRVFDDDKEIFLLGIIDKAVDAYLNAINNFGKNKEAIGIHTLKQFNQLEDYKNDFEEPENKNENTFNVAKKEILGKKSDNINNDTQYNLTEDEQKLYNENIQDNFNEVKPSNIDATNNYNRIDGELKELNKSLEDLQRGIKELTETPIQIDHVNSDESDEQVNRELSTLFESASSNMKVTLRLLKKEVIYRIKNGGMQGGNATNTMKELDIMYIARDANEEIIDQTKFIETLTPIVTENAAIWKTKYHDYMEALWYIADFIMMSRFQRLYMRQICNNRGQEGNFINNSLKELREVFSEMNIAKNEGSIDVVPNFVDVCMKEYCRKYENCFETDHNIIPDYSSIKSVLMDSIYKNIYSNSLYDDESISVEERKKRIKHFYQEIQICAFCVVNISINQTTNNPPPAPYIDINRLKVLFYNYRNVIFGNPTDSEFKYSGKVSEENKVIPTVSGKSNITEIIQTGRRPKKLTIRQEFKQVCEDLENLIDKKYQKGNCLSFIQTIQDYPIYQNFKKFNNEYLSQILIDKRDQTYDKVKTDLDAIQLNKIDTYVNVIQRLIGFLDNSNAISTIGTMEFMDQFSKYNQTNIVCKLPTNVNPTNYGMIDMKNAVLMHRTATNNEETYQIKKK